MSTAGQRAYPCHHMRARLPTEPGQYPRTCKVCHGHWTLTVAISEPLTAKLGAVTLHARWTPLETAA